MKLLLLMCVFFVVSCKDGFDRLQDKFDDNQSHIQKLQDSLKYYYDKGDSKSAERINLQMDAIFKYQDRILDAQTDHIKMHESFPF